MDFFELLFSSALDLLNSSISFEPIRFILVSAAVMVLVVFPIARIFHIGD